jgi:hypothetical protein
MTSSLPGRHDGTDEFCQIAPSMAHSIVFVEHFMILFQKKVDKFNRQGSRVILHRFASSAWWLRNR